MFEKQSFEEVLQDLQTSPQGLTDAEAAERLIKDGANVLPEKAPPTAVQRFFSQLKDPMIYILFAAAAVSIALKEYSDAVIILCVVLLNAVVGMVQEGKAQKALDALKQMSSPTATVRRGGVVKEIPSADLVKGDIVLLDAGRSIPADLRITKSIAMKVEESALTGESVPVDKNASFVTNKELPIGDRVNMAYMSTSVAAGRGEGVVVYTATETEIGKIATIISDTENEMTPLQVRLADLSKILGLLAIVICLAMFGLAVIQKRDFGEMLLTAISLAVAAVPEGLPAVVTIVLAIGVQRMAKVNSIVRRLPAVETLGAVSVVCSDKTGTLTINRMTVAEIYENKRFFTPEEFNYTDHRLFMDGFILCGDASITEGQRVGDPTEIAMLDLGLLYDVTKEPLAESAPRINEQAFDSERKLMTTVHIQNERVVAFTKGATDELLQKCTYIMADGHPRPITQEDIDFVKEDVRKMARKALRVLALAVKYDDNTATEADLCFLGMVGMIDPARPEAKPAVESFKQAGITTVMITGDHIETGFAIASDLGIATSMDECITGADFDKLPPEEVAERIKSIRVFARVSPSHKVKIVTAFKDSGLIVSMTGDGVNDAPSLKAADIGVAMGITGTDVAKSAADMILTDDNFATIEKAVEEGRSIYANIKKTVLFLLSSNLGEVFAMFTAIAAGLASPLKAVHILWVNLVTDTLPALALGADTKQDGLMKEKPRDAKESLFAHGGLATTVFYGLLIAAITLGAFLIVPVTTLQSAGLPVNLAGIASVLSDAEWLTHSQTYAFSVLAVSQLFHALGMHDVDHSIFTSHAFRNKSMVLAFFAGFGLQILATEVPFLISAFNTFPLTVNEWLMLTAIATAPLVAHEIIVVIKKLTKKAD